MTWIFNPKLLCFSYAVGRQSVEVDEEELRSNVELLEAR